MLTEQESNDMHAMVNEFETANDWFKLRALAEATGDFWENLVRGYLADWRAQRNANGPVSRATR